METWLIQSPTMELHLPAEDEEALVEQLVALFAPDTYTISSRHKLHMSLDGLWTEFAITPLSRRTP